MGENLIESFNLSKNYGQIQALKEACFSIKKGTITAFLGENGAGKTTTIKIILGFLKPDSGIVKKGNARIGYVPDRPLFFPWATGEEILEVTAKLFRIDLFGLPGLIENTSARIGFDQALLNRKAQTYSMGNQKKMSYLQNLLIKPELLVVDEPFTGLDPISIRLVRDLFLELKKEGKTIFLSSHLISELEKICEEVIIIRKGQVLLEDNLKKIRQTTNSDLETIFLSLHQKLLTG
ncbi:MAG: ABC transporter ATP-binding protein [Candidatus Saccharicenans sp.]